MQPNDTYIQTETSEDVNMAEIYDTSRNRPPLNNQFPQIWAPTTKPMPPNFPHNPPNQQGSIRFIYAATDQPPVDIQIDSQTVVSNIRYGNVTPYYITNIGRRTITITAVRSPRTVFARTTMIVASNNAYTVAIVNRNGGLSLFVIPDLPCWSISNNACVRVVNLSAQENPLTVLLSNGGEVFNNVSFLEITPYKNLSQGNHSVLVTQTPNCILPISNTLASMVACNGNINLLLATSVNLIRGLAYTLYLIGNHRGFPSLKVKTLENDF